MSMMLWKSAALLGVMGVGSAVVFQAQKSLSNTPKEASAAADEFDELELPGDETDGDDELFADAGELNTEAAAPAGQGEEPGEDVFAAFATASKTEEEESNPFATAQNDSQGQQNAASPPDNPFAIEDAPVANSEPDAASPWGDFSAAPAGNEEAVVETTETSQPEAAAIALDDSPASPMPVPPADLLENPVLMTATMPPSEAAKTGGAESPELANGLHKLAPGNDGPVLMSPPNTEAEASEPENPFAQFDAAPANNVETADGIASEEIANPFEATDSAASSTASTPLRSSIPPMENRHSDPAVTNANSELSSIPQRVTPVAGARLRGTPDVADPENAGLASPRVPQLPGVSPAFAPQEEPEETPPALSITDEPEVQERPGLSSIPAIPDIPDITLAAGDDSKGLPEVNPTLRPNPSTRSSIPAGSAAPPVVSSVPPGVKSSIPDTSAAESASPPRTLPGLSAAPPESEFPEFELEPKPEVKPAASKGPDLVGAGVIDRDVAQGPAQPQLTIVKHAPKEASIGQDLEYSILVKNIGKSAAHNVVVEDQIPKGTECTGTAPKCETENKKLIWRLGAIEPGAEQLLRIRVTPTAAGEIGSIATVSFSAEVAARTKIIEPTAQLKVTGPDEIVVGQSGNYRLALRNDGPVDLKEIWVRTVLPEGLNHAGGRDLEYEVGDLPRGQSREVTLSLEAVTPGNWQHNVLLTQRGRELSRTTTDVDIIESRIVVSRTGPSKRFVGRAATYSNTVTNTSTKPLTEITVVETLPPGLDLSGPPRNARWDASRRTLTWTIQQLAPGATIDLPVSVMPRSAGTLSGQLLASDAAGNQAEVATSLDVAGFSSLAVDMTHDGRPIPVGEQVSLQFTVKNSGTAPAEQVQAMFELPEEVKFINAQGPAKFDRIGNIITFDAVASLPAGADLKFDVVFQAIKATPPNGERVRVSLNSTQVPKDNPLVQQQQIVVFGEEQPNTSTVLQAGGTR